MNTSILFVILIALGSCADVSSKNGTPSNTKDYSQSITYVRFRAVPNTYEIPESTPSNGLALAHSGVFGAKGDKSSPVRSAPDKATLVAQKAKRLDRNDDEPRREAPSPADLGIEEAQTVPRQQPLEVAGPKRKPISMSTIFAAIADKGTEPGPLDLFFQDQAIELKQSFQSSKNTLGVHLLEHPDMGRIIVRYEHFVPQTVAQAKAQEVIAGKAGFAPTGRIEVFDARDGKHTRIEGQIMVSGGRNFGLGADGRPQPLSLRAALDILFAAETLNKTGVANLDAKPENFVQTIPTRGAMTVDHSGMLHVASITAADRLVLTYIAPEVIATAQRTRQSLGQALRSQLSESGPVAINNWLHGHTIFAAITGKTINFRRDGGKRPYPSSRVLRQELIAAGRGENIWILGHLDAIVSLLHPDPLKRSQAGRVAELVRENSSGSALPPIAEWP